MMLEYFPLLQIQRDLYEVPRGSDRFQSYLKTMVDAESGEMELPLSLMNPMGKDHLPALLDRYLEIGADRIAAEALATLPADHLSWPSSPFRLGLVIADDLMGGWTNRYASEFSHRFESRPLFRRGWLTGVLWSSESPDADLVRETVLTALYRGFMIDQHGFASTLAEMMAQEGAALTLAGSRGPVFDDPAEIEYTRAVLEPLRAATDLPTQMVALFGDDAAKALGYPALGLSHRAGFALAKHESADHFPSALTPI